MTTHTVGIIMNGVTGRMGLNQHLRRSVYAIMEQGGVKLSDSETILPRPLLVGRNPAKLEAISKEFGGLPWSTDLGAALADPQYSIYFDAQTTDRHAAAVRSAIAAGKHIYCEKPISDSLATALDLYNRAVAAGVKHGVVQDKLWLPGLMKLQTLKRAGILRPHLLGARRVRLLGLRGRHGAGTAAVVELPQGRRRRHHPRHAVPLALRVGQSVRQREGGFLPGSHPHPAAARRSGQPYDCTADDAAYATFELEGGIVAHFNSSWCVRVRRDDLLTIQVDGTKGTAIAGLRHCWIQPYGATPRPVWNPDIDSPLNYFDGWQKVPEQDTFDNAFKRQWELFLRHVVKDEPFRWGLLEGAKGVQLAEKGIESWHKRAWVDVPELG